MDTGTGNLAELDQSKFEELKEKQVTGIFKEGQIVEVNGSKFIVHAIRPPKKIVLKLMPGNHIEG